MSETAQSPFLETKKTLPRAWDRMRVPAYNVAFGLALLLVSAVAAPTMTSAAQSLVTTSPAATEGGDAQRGGVSDPAGSPKNDRHGDTGHRHGHGLRVLWRGESQLPAAQDAPGDGQQQHHLGRGR